MSGAPVPPRFSIVIPCFNQGTFLAECLASLRAQTLPAHEVIVVDDGSTDPYSVRRMDALCVDGVTLLRQENRGLSGARNAGIRAATGTWIVPLDADDCLAPEALATYARAIAEAPEVDIWYPDIQHFGQDTTAWESAPFNPWQQLWSNQLVCSSAIRRSVFDAGVFYNERMRQGYEDWEFFVQACVERGFLGRGLERAVFHYRRWGYSMLSESNARREALVEQLHRERPIYQDAERLLRLKQQHDPYLAIAAGSELLRPALDTQHVRDFQLVDESDRVRREGDLRVFQGRRFARLMVSLEDAPLASAFRGDAFLLEKVVRVLAEQQPALLWLVTTGPGQAWPGFLLQERETRGADLRCVGFCVNPALLLDAPPIPRTEAGLLVDLARHLAERSAPGAMATLVVGSGPALEPGVPGAHLPPEVRPSWRRGLSERKGLLREGVRMVGKGANKMLRGLVGERAHEGLLSQPLVRRLRPGARKNAAPAPGAPAPVVALPPAETEAASHVRAGPFTPAQRFLTRQRRSLFTSLDQPPRLQPQPPPGADPALMILAPWVIHGGVDRALVDLLQGLARIAPHQRRYLVTTNSHDRPGAMTWADEVLPCVSGAFCVPDLAPQGDHAFIAELAKRLKVGAVLNANSLVGFDALPRLRQEVPGLRVISQAHTFPKHPVTGELFGACAFSASKYNNLIDGYATICQETADRLVQHFYVSPTKVRIVMLGVDTARFGAAYHPRFVPGVRPRVLWLGRLAPEKNPLMCLQIARLWKQRHGSDRLGFHITGSGSEEAALHAYVREHALRDVVTLEPAVDDPVPQYQHADCLLLTSLYEGIPVVIYEAMAAGLPVVASVKNTSITDVLSTKEAWLLQDPSGPADYVAALEELLAHPAEAQARGERMRQASARFDRLRYARETLEMLFPQPRQEPLKRATT